MKLGDIVTAEQLVAEGACSEQVDIFREVWPDGGKLTLTNIFRAAELHLDLDWFAGFFLDAPALEAYEKACAPALEAYEKACAPAWEAYEKATAQALEAYQKATAPAREAYQKATAPALYNALKGQ